MNDRKKMDIRLKIIEELYEGDGSFADRIRAERPDVSREVESLRAMKSALDARPARRPEAATLDAVLKAAADGASGRGPDGRHPTGRLDRPPRARRALYLRSAGVATAVLAVLIAVSTVWQAGILDKTLPAADDEVVANFAGDEHASAATDSEDQSPPESRDAGFVDGPSASPAVDPVERSGASDRTLNLMAVQESYAHGGNAVLMAGRDESDDPRPAAFKATGRDMRLRPSDILPVGMRPMNVAAYAGEAHGQRIYRQATDDDLAWDQAADVMEVYYQIEMIGEGVSSGWEPPSVPLEMAPAFRQHRGSGIEPAVERRNP